MGLGDRIKHAWNAFTDQNDRYLNSFAGDTLGPATISVNPSRTHLFGIPGGEKSIPTSIYTRLSIDCTQVDIRHVRLDVQDRYMEDMKGSGLYNCLTVEANIDQAARFFKQDIFSTLFTEGCIALVPVDTSVSPEGAGSVDIQTMRVGTIVEWYPRHVRIDLYNDRTGRHEQIVLHKSAVGIVTNPLYAVMNERNSTLQRLIRKLAILDAIDEQSGSGKMDMIIQLPYTIRTEQKREQARQRRKDLEDQLKDSRYGVAYADATEKIVQLNRPVENNLLGTVEFLTNMLYAQLGLTPSVMDGTADEATMLNYINRTIEPVIAAVAEEMHRKFLSKTARTQGQSIEYFRDPFKLVPLSQVAELADKFTRNEILTPNEVRQFIGMKPSTDAKADQLRNPNMPADLTQPSTEVVPGEVVDPVDDNPFEGINSVLDDVFNELGVDG